MRSKSGSGRKRNGGGNPRTASLVNNIPNENLTVVAEAIIAGVTKATKDNDSNVSVITESSSVEKINKGKYTAEAGSVGEFITKHCQEKSNENDS